MGEIFTDTQIAAELEANLLADMNTHNSQGINSRILLGEFDPDGRLAAGIGGYTSYGWLLIKLLWVDQAYRRQGMATSLVRRACETAKTRGCHSVWLDTSSKTALEFYQHLGFEKFGELQNPAGRKPEGHRRFFLRQKLDHPAIGKETQQ